MPLAPLAGTSALPAHRAQPWPKPSCAWYALALFTLATMMNFLDRAVFGLMGAASSVIGMAASVPQNVAIRRSRRTRCAGR